MSDNPTYKKLMRSYHWQQLRLNYLRAFPVCELCEKEGKSVWAQEVHHKIPVQSGVTEEGMAKLAFDPTNLQALCRECHHKVHEESVRSWSKEKNKAKAHKAVLDFVKEFLKGGE